MNSTETAAALAATILHLRSSEVASRMAALTMAAQRLAAEVAKTDSTEHSILESIRTPKGASVLMALEDDFKELSQDMLQQVGETLCKATGDTPLPGIQFSPAALVGWIADLKLIDAE